MDKPIIKEIKKWLGDVVDPNNATSERVDYGLHTMYDIALLSRAVQDLANRGLPADLTATTINSCQL